MKVNKIEIVFLIISVLAGIAAIYSPSDYYQKNRKKVQSGQDLYPYPYPYPTLVVNINEDSDDGFCDTFLAGVTDCTLREAINYANSNTGPWIINFAGNYTITLGSQLPAVTSTIIINGNGTLKTIIQAKSVPNTATYRVLQVGAGGNLTLYGATVRHGNLPDSNGGGIYNQGQLTIIDSYFLDNTAREGGGVFNDLGQTLTITGTTFFNNSALTAPNNPGGSAGAVSNGGTLTISNSFFRYNKSIKGGGAIVNNLNSVATISDSSFTGNTTSFSGGAIQNLDASMILQNCTFDLNEVFGGNNAGGAIYNDGEMTVIGGSFTNNTAGLGKGGAIANLDTLNLSGAVISTNTASLGGGIYNSGLEITITNATLNANTVDLGGGGIANEWTGNGSMIIAGSTISDNSAPNGGGIHNLSTTGLVSFSDITINNNISTTNGGGIASFGPLELNTVTLSGNSAENGGGVFSLAALTITNSTLSGNSASFAGAGIYNSTSNPSLTNVIFSDNFANSAGGGIYSDNSSPSLSNVTFSDNSAQYGGGIFNDNGSPSLSNVTFSGNSALAGGGMNNHTSSNPSLTNVTFSANSATVGGGIYNGGTLNFANTIIANSTTGGDCVNAGSGTIGINTNNLIEDASNACGLVNGSNFNITGSDPALGSLTGSPAYLLLNTGSPAINAGSNTICAAAPVNNQSQNGVTRPQGVNCDIGSVEAVVAITVTIGGTNQGNYNLAPETSQRVNYAGVNNGPARVSSTTNILASMRVLFGNVSYSEMMGFPADQLTNEYVFPYYNNTAMDSQLRVSNLGGVDTTINVYVGSSPTPIDTYTLAAGAATRKNYAGVNNGPLRVTSSATNIITTIRVLFGGLSYSELVGFPANQLTTEYIFPYYNNVAMDSQLRVSNMGASTTTINVYVGSSPTPIDTYTLAAGAASRKNYAGVNSGPLRVTSSATNILTTIRVLFGGLSYSELLGFPVNQLTTSYSYPVYDNVSIDSQLRVSNVGNATTTITVFSGSTQIDSYDLAAGAATRINYSGVDNGPLKVVSSTQPILTTTRMLYLTSSFSSYYEMTGMPDNQLHTEYVFPWYNNTAMSSQVRFAVP